MRKFRWSLYWFGLIVLAVVLVACNGDDDDANGNDQTDGTDTSESIGFNPDIGPGLDVSVGGGSWMPGCSDPNDEECPAPLSLDMDGKASADGVSIVYPTRYFTTVSGDDLPDGVLIEIGPNDRYPFDEQATFQVYFAESVEDARSELADPMTVEWSTDTLAYGTISVVKDREQDPAVNTVIGAFPLDDGRAIVLKLVTTGKYGWDLYSVTYDTMLNSLTVSEPTDSSSGE